MRRSRYLKTFRYQEITDSLIVYSTKKTSLTLLGKELFHSIDKQPLSPEDKAAANAAIKLFHQGQ